MSSGLSRRAFTSALASTLLPQWLAACSTGARRGAAPARFASDPFALGVASGEPASDGFVIWTRLVGEILPAGPIGVGWELAEDEGFKRIVHHGDYSAIPELGHSVHVELKGLRPGRPYWYRFLAGDAVSRAGRSLTLPNRASRLRCALVSCQNWDHGYFTAYRDMQQQNLDLVLHVGDYIYERSWGEPPFARAHGLAEAVDLASYRARHAKWKTDPDLQAAHAALPFVASWDDHEVANDYAGLASGQGQPADAFARRRAQAYQAYFEHMPLRPSMLRADGGVDLYRRFQWGELASLHVLDTRQYRDDQACAVPGELSGRALRDCPQLRDPARSLMGASQEAWLYRGLQQESARWSVIAQQLLFSQLDLDDAPGLASWSDFWDGYRANRDRLLQGEQQPSVRNALMLGGDIHSFWAADVKADFDRPGSPTVASEFVTTSLASRNPEAARFGNVRANNPHVQAVDLHGSGYLLLDFDKERVRADLRMVDDLNRADSDCHTRHSLVVVQGSPGPRPA